MATLPGVEDTVALGSRLGGQLRAGDVVVLSGPLGAGKTVLDKGIAAAMDVDGPVTSPTFVLAHGCIPARRTGAPAMIHVDVYRLLDHTGADLLDEEARNRWISTPSSMNASRRWWSGQGEGLAERLSDRHLDVRLERISSSDMRTATITWVANGAGPCSRAGHELIDARDRHRHPGGHRWAGPPGRRPARGSRRAGQHRRPRARRTDHPECVGRTPRRCRALGSADLDAVDRRLRLRVRSPRTAGRYAATATGGLRAPHLACRCTGSTASMPSRPEQTTGETLVVTTTPAGARSTGPAIAAGVRIDGPAVSAPARRSTLVVTRGRLPAQPDHYGASSPGCRACNPLYRQRRPGLVATARWPTSVATPCRVGAAVSCVGPVRQDRHRGAAGGYAMAAT